MCTLAAGNCTVIHNAATQHSYFVIVLSRENPYIEGMMMTKEWFQGSMGAGLQAFGSFLGRSHLPPSLQPSGGKKRSSAALVPIRALSERHRQRIAEHLLSLDDADRYLRFGYSAGNTQIERYVEQLDFKRDDIYGIFNRRLKMIAMAHVAFADTPGLESCAEFGVSVLQSARGRGLGARLFDRAVMDARAHGVSMLFIHALSENTAMLKIARKAGAKVERDGSESEAYLKLPPAGFDTRMADMVENHMGEMDYQFKKQAQQFWGLLATVQEVRRSVQEGRHRSGQ